MYRDNEKCILCRRCVAACEKLQGISVIGANDRGFATHIGSAFEADLDETSCVSCGQCIVNCPTGALSERDDTQKVFDDLLKTAHSSAYALDRVHPNGIGHMAIAKAFLDAIGFEWK